MQNRNLKMINSDAPEHRNSTRNPRQLHYERFVS